MKKIYFQFKGPETTHPEIVLIILGLICIFSVIFLICIGLFYTPMSIWLSIISSLIVVGVTGFLISIVYIYENKYIKEKYGEKEPYRDRIQIYVYDDEIVYVKKLIHGKENRKVIKASNAVDIKLRPTIIIYKPKNYRSIAKEFDILSEIDLYEKKKLWITLNLPKMSYQDKKNLKNVIEEFKKRNKITGCK